MTRYFNGVDVLGGGVAGSVLAYLSKKSGLQVRLFDIVPKYRKPCGEAIPSWLVEVMSEHGIPLPKIVDEISVFSFYAPDGRLIRRLEFGEAVWYIIDKSEWLNRLRRSVGVILLKSRASCRGIASSRLVFDARGPFASRGLKVVVWQADVENFAGLKGEAIQVIDFRKSPGLVWIFSRGKYLNIGGGFYGLRDPRSDSVGLVERIMGISDLGDYILAERYSMVTIDPEIILASSGCFKVGEAAGLVMSLGGEGIRPALLSAIAAYNSLKEGGRGVSFDLNSYALEVRDLVYQVRLNKLIFKLGLGLGQVFVEKVLRGLSEDLMKEWFSGRLGLGLGIPVILNNVLRALLIQ